MALCQDVDVWHDMSKTKGRESKKKREKEHNMEKAFAVLDNVLSRHDISDAHS